MAMISGGLISRLAGIAIGERTKRGAALIATGETLQSLAGPIQAIFQANAARLDAQAEYQGAQYDARIITEDAKIGVIEDNKTIALERARQFRAIMDSILGTATEVDRTITSTDIIARA